MLNLSTEINTALTIAFPIGTVVPGSINIDVLQDGTPTVVAVTATEPVTGIISIEYTPTVVGLQHIIADGNVIANLEVVNRSIHEALESLEDVALGSWILDKGTDVLTLYTQQGAPLALYDVVDNTAQTSREKQ